MKDVERIIAGTHAEVVDAVQGKAVEGKGSGWIGGMVLILPLQQ